MPGRGVKVCPGCSRVAGRTEGALELAVVFGVFDFVLVL
jgi:hypothetical protein